MVTIGYTLLRKFSNFKQIPLNLAKICQKVLTNVQEMGITPCCYDEVVPHIFVIKVTNGKSNELSTKLNDIG